MKNRKNPLKEFFKPRSVVGVNITSTSIGVVKIFNTMKGPELVNVAFKEIESWDEVGDGLQEIFNDEDFKHEMLITCLPGSSTFIREIPIPFQKSRKLDKIIKYQMEPFVPHAIEKMVVDYLPPKPEGVTMAIAAEKKVLAEHLERFEQADLKPDMVNLDEIALFLLHSFVSPDDAKAYSAIIHLTDEKTGIQVIRDKNLDFFRILPGSEDPSVQVSETFKLVYIKNPDIQFDKVLLVSDKGQGEELAKKISEVIETDTLMWRPFDKIKKKNGDMDSDLQSKLSVPLGLAVSLSDTFLKPFDFRKEEFSIKSALDLRKTLIIMLSLWFFLAIVFGFHLYQRVHIQESRHTELKNDIKDIFIKTFPNTKIVTGRELVLMKQKLDEEAETFKWLDHLTQQGTVLDIISNLTTTISEFKDVIIENFSVEDEEIRIDGNASSFETVDRLKEKLSSSGAFSTVKLAGAKMDKKTSVVKFNFGLEKKK